MNPTTKRVWQFSISSVLLLLIVGCSTKPSVSPQEQEKILKTEREYSTSDLQKKYDQMVQREKSTVSQEETKRNFDKSVDNTFSNIEKFIKELHKKDLQKRHPLSQTGKDREIHTPIVIDPTPPTTNHPNNGVIGYYYY